MSVSDADKLQGCLPMGCRTGPSKAGVLIALRRDQSGLDLYAALPETLHGGTFCIPGRNVTACYIQDTSSFNVRRTSVPFLAIASRGGTVTPSVPTAIHAESITSAPHPNPPVQPHLLWVYSGFALQFLRWGDLAR